MKVSTTHLTNHRGEFCDSSTPNVLRPAITSKLAKIRASQSSFLPSLEKMEAIDDPSAFPPRNTDSTTGTFETPQDFGPFNSPPHSHKAQAIKKRKRTTDHEHSTSADAPNQAGGYNVLDLNSPVQSNPDIDAFIRSRRKPREKKSCQICRYGLNLIRLMNWS